MDEITPVEANPIYAALDALIANPAVRRVRVTRTLIYEGTPLWLKATLERSWVQTETGQTLPNGCTIRASCTEFEEL